ncbi:MAG: class I SAM-dependent methyltransferase [Candidatus Parcubacteria bacterium]|nr:class I SAM-dependent methyltransferase [Candidatus Parcubacteria bacterium]
MTIFNLLFLLVALCLLSLAIASISLAPWVPTWKKDLPRILKLAALKPGETFYDLGCGNGKVAIYAAKNFNAQVIGLEMAVPLYLICRLRQLFTINKNLIFKYKNFYKEDLSKANVVYVFGQAKTLGLKFTQKLSTELNPGARVISYVFPIEGWTPKIIDKPSPKDIAIFLYEIH